MSELRQVFTICAALLLLGAPAGALAQTARTASPVAVGANTQTGIRTDAYHLGAGDRLRIIVFGEADLSGEYDISTAGKLTFPLVGEIDAAGQTPEQIAEQLAARLRDGFMRDPNVVASVISYRPFYILGEVGNPGTYPYAPNLDVMSAVAVAGGFTYRANRRRVFIRHAGEAEEQSYRLGDVVRVRPGDTVRIGERLF